MKKKRLPKSVRKFIRREKARVRREVLSVNEQKDLINKIYNGLSKEKTEKKDEHKRDLQASDK